MFKKAEIGDRVWDFIHEYGTIVSIDLDKELLHVLFDCGTEVDYDFEGRTSPNSKPRLFWSEIEYEIPKKPISTRKVLEEDIKNLEIVPFVYDQENYYLEWNYTNSKLIIGKSTRNEKPLLYFSKDSIDKLLKDIDELKLLVTKDTFFELYFKIFYNIGEATIEFKTKDVKWDIKHYREIYDRIVNRLKASIRPNTLDTNFFNAIDKYRLQYNGTYKVVFRQNIYLWLDSPEFEHWKDLIIETVAKEVDLENIDSGYNKCNWYFDDKVIEFRVYD